MTQRISTYQRFKMMNPIIQFFRFIYLSLKVLIIVAGGHGATRKVHQDSDK
ncbi:MAG: hypothetical protein ACM31G_06285 [Flavobacteriales bacterium]